MEPMEPRVGEIPGWRVWGTTPVPTGVPTRAVGLRSYIRDTLWPPDRPMEALCYGAGCKFALDADAPPPPHQGGTCGIYATRDPQDLGRMLMQAAGAEGRAHLLYGGIMVVGVADLWGIVREGDTGVYRAQYARPVALARLWGPTADDWVGEVIARYGLAVREAPPALVRQVNRWAITMWA